MKKEKLNIENIVGIFVILLLASVFVMPVSAQSSSIPIKLELTAEPSTIEVGETAIITVRLLDENGGPVETEVDITVSISTDFGSVPSSSIVIPAGAEISKTKFTSKFAGMAVISAKSKGLISDTTSIAVIVKAPYPPPPYLYLIPGHVYDSDGSVVEGAKVTLTNLNTTESIELFTNSQGEYIFELSNLPGAYSIGDHIRIDAKKDSKNGHRSFILVDFSIFAQQITEEDGINIYLKPTPTPTPAPTLQPRRPSGGGGGGGGVSDSDGDGYSDIEELILGTDPYDPCDPNPSSVACIGEAIIGKVITTPKPTPYDPTKGITPPTTESKATIPPLEKEPEEPEKEPGVPGFEAVFAIAGLLAVAYLLRRRG